MTLGTSQKECGQAMSQGVFLEKLKRFFPERLYFEILRIFESCRGGERIEEIRLRRDRCAYLTIGAGASGNKRNVATDIFLLGEELSLIFEKMCDGSLYAYSESIIKGYVSLSSGMRVGVCGRAAVEKEKIFGVYDISALNIRIPCANISADSTFLDIVRKNIRIGQGILIFSPPAQGKTTCLRSLAYELALGDEPMRVSVVDTRGELSFMPDNPKLSIDMLIGYPKAEGIRISTLFMNPEVIICDEIGTEEEARAIADAQNCGVPLIASAHGGTLNSVMLKRGIVTLHSACAFGVYVLLRIGSGGRLTYSLYSREEADKALENNRLAHNNF